MAWTNWSLDPSLAYVIPAGLLYLVGGRARPWERENRWRAAAFYAGLLTIVLALDSAIDSYADQLLWVHMLQHILLLTVAPPLILLGRPWPRMWSALPLSTRTAVGRSLASSRWTAPLRALAHPLPALILFNATLIGWHIPAAYDATLRSGTVHVIEHAMFFFTGLLFWAHVVDPGPLRPRLDWLARSGYVVFAMVAGWVLAIVLVVVSHPLYTPYANLAVRPGGITALEDQQIAGGMMWVPGSISYTIAVIFAFWRWVAPDPAPKPAQPALMT